MNDRRTPSKGAGIGAGCTIPYAAPRLLCVSYAAAKERFLTAKSTRPKRRSLAFGRRLQSISHDFLENTGIRYRCGSGLGFQSNIRILARFLGQLFIRSTCRAGPQPHQAPQNLLKRDLRITKTHCCSFADSSNQFPGYIIAGRDFFSFQKAGLL
jgi:hypothetical protein